MLTRRGVLRGAGLAASLSIRGGHLALGESRADPRIAGLKSRRHEARPITTEERLRRIERARELMRSNHLDAIAMIGGTSLVYITNIHWWNSERFFIAVLPARGEPFFVAPAFEEARAREQIAAGPLGPNAQVLTWQEDDDPYALFAAGLKERASSPVLWESKKPCPSFSRMALPKPLPL